MDNALDQAIDHCRGVTKLAAAIGAGQTVVSNWKKRGTVIPPLYCARIEALPGCPVKRWHLRPDDWQEIWPELVGTKGAPAMRKRAHHLGRAPAIAHP